MLKKQVFVRNGFTMIEMVISILMASILTVGLAVVLLESQRGWNFTYSRANEDIGIDGHVARQTFESLIRKASAEQITIDALGNWIEVSYYDDPATSTELDRYSRLYLDSGSLMIEEGQLDPKVALSTQSVCGNVTACQFIQNGRSAQMVLTLAQGSRQNTVASSAFMHNQ